MNIVNFSTGTTFKPFCEASGALQKILVRVDAVTRRDRVHVVPTDSTDELQQGVAGQPLIIVTLLVSEFGW